MASLTNWGRLFLIWEMFFSSSHNGEGCPDKERVILTREKTGAKGEDCSDKEEGCP